jgi:hypothetical protein
VAISTYTLAVEAYELVKGYYTQAGLTPPSDTPGSETYGGLAVPARMALRALGYAAGTIAIEDAHAIDFTNLLLYYGLANITSAIASANSTSLTVGPIKIENKEYRAEITRLWEYYRGLVAHILGIPLGNQIVVSDRTWDWENELNLLASEYASEVV